MIRKITIVRKTDIRDIDKRETLCNSRREETKQNEDKEGGGEGRES